MSLKKRILIIAGVVAIALVYYAVSPLFRNIVVDDSVPVSMEGTGEHASSTKNEIVYAVVDTPLHPASGTLRVVRDGEKTFVRYENYKTINGPDLFVYLSKDLDAKEFVNLGELRGTEGNINYEVPEGVRIEDYRYVLTWCKQFGVLFNSVDLQGSQSESVEASILEEKTMTEEKEEAQTPSIVNTIPKPVTSGPQKAIMGTGCFWCVEHDFAKVEGVIDVISGYAGGTNENPTYENYDDYGHREVVEVTYDPTKLSYGNIVEHTIKYGDPTDGAGSFYDRGEEYAPVIHYENEWEKKKHLR